MAVGAAMAIIGAGVVVAVSLPVGATTVSETDRSWVTFLGPGSWQPHAFAAVMVPRGTASFAFSWNASGSAEVDWYAASPCGNPLGWCRGPWIANWSATSGLWHGSGRPMSGYYVLVNNSGNATVTFTGEFVESYPDAEPHLGVAPLAWTMGGGGLLIGMGALAIYLGIFLPSGVYEGRPQDDLTNPEYYDDLGPIG